MLGLTSKPVFLTMRLCHPLIVLHMAVFPKHKFAHGLHLVKQSSPTFANRVKFRFLVLADRALTSHHLPQSLISPEKTSIELTYRDGTLHAGSFLSQSLKFTVFLCPIYTPV